MSTRIGDLAIVISASTAGLGRDLSRAGSMVGSFAGTTIQRFADAGRAIGGVAQGLADIAGFKLDGGLKEMAASAIDLAKAAEVSAMKFEVLTGSVEKARDLMKDLREFAAASPVSQADAFKHGASLLGVGVEQQQIAPTLNRLSEVSMGDKETLASWVRVYGQVKSMGRLTGSDWLQIANTNTLGYGDLAKVLKHDSGRQVDAGEVKKLIEEGRVGFYDLQVAIKQATEAGGRFFGMNAKYSETYAGKLDKLKDSWDEIKRDIGTGLVDGLGLKGAADEMGRTLDQGKKFAEVMKGVAALVGTLARNLAEKTSWLYRAGLHLGAATQGDFSTIGKGEEAKANLAAQDRRAQLNMGKHGIDYMSAVDLATYVDESTKAKQQEEKIQELIRLRKSQAGFAESKRMEGLLLADIRDNLEPRLKAATVERERADAMVQSILARGDPSKITLTPEGRPFTPVKPPLDPRLTELATKLNDSLTDPAKKLADDLADLKKIADVGKFDPGVLERATADVIRDAAKEAGIGDHRLAPVAELGSQQLANMVSRAGMSNGPQTVEGLLKVLADLSRQQLEQGKELVRQALRPAPTMTMPE